MPESRRQTQAIGWLFEPCGALVGAAVWEWCDLWHVGGAPSGAFVDCSARSEQWLDAARTLALLSSLPGLAEPLAWLLWPRALREAVRRTRIRKKIGDTLTDPRRWGTVEATAAAVRDFDPECGVHGLPRPVHEEPAPDAPGGPVALRSRGVPLLRGCELQQVRDSRETPVAWDGRALLLTTEGGERVRVPLSDTPQDAPPVPVASEPSARGLRRVTTLAERPAVIVLVQEVGIWDRLLLLDADGLVLLRFRSRRLDAAGLAKIATAAGLPFAHYDLGRTSGDGDRVRLADLLFPSRRGSRYLNDG
jgi:hypothetical protein